MSLRFKLVAATVLLAALGGAGWLLLSGRVRRVETTHARGPGLDAQRNPYLATSRILDRLGFRVHEANELHRGNLPPTDATLIVPVDREPLGTAHNRELLDWAVRGGHLVVVPTLPEGALGDVQPPADALLDAVGITGKRREDAELLNELPWGGTHVEEPEPELLTVRIGDQPDELRVGPYSGVELFGDIEVAWSVGSDETAVAASIATGDGLVTVLTESHFLRNRYVGYGDNAYLLAELAALQGGDDVWLTSRLRPPTVYDLIVEYALLACLSLVVLLAAWVWRHAVRFGPLVPETPLSRRSLMEHVRASGLLIWRHGGRRALVRAVQRAVCQRAARRTAGWTSLSPHEQNRRVAKLARVPEEDVSAALGPVAPRKAAQLVRLITLLETLRSRL